jgi:23S rRNA pseudouridine2605 synthase
MAKAGESPKRRGRGTLKSTPKVTRTARKPLRTPAKRTPVQETSVPVVSKSQKLQKVLAQAGLGSRRAMEQLIEAGKVKVNSEAATLGQRVTSEDVIEFGRRRIQFKVTARLPRVILYHKPEGEIVTRDDPKGRTSVFEKLPTIRSAKWLAVGRLDFNTCGLLIFTTSGELANRLMHPRFEVEREYAVRIFGVLSDDAMRQLRTGVRLSDGLARFDELEAKGGEGRNHWYRVVLKEGRNRVVRRMFESLGLRVSRLMRIRFGLVTLPANLKRGTWIEIKEAEIRNLLSWVGSEPPVVSPKTASSGAASSGAAKSGAANARSANSHAANSRTGRSRPAQPRAAKSGAGAANAATSTAAPAQRKKPRKSSALSKKTKSSPAAVASQTKGSAG